MVENEFWKVCEALDCEQRIAILRYLLEADGKEYPCVIELADHFKLSTATMSVHLKKLAMAGLVTSKRVDRRVYYRAFATTSDGARVLSALTAFFATRPNEKRTRNLLIYAHALSHARRNAVVRVLHGTPKLGIRDLAVHADMPPATADRLWGELEKAHVIDLDGAVIVPIDDPEATLLDLTLA